MIQHVLLTLVTILVSVNAYPNFIKSIPNGDKVKFDGEKWPGVGHGKVYGGGDLNAFGRDFARAGNKWTEELCRLDSDGDGRSNGEELGDPNCIWKLGDPHPKARFVTHPGVLDECPAPPPAPSVMKIALLGAGGVGKALMKTFSDAGLTTSFGVRNLATHSGDGNTMLTKEAAEWASVVFLTLPGNVVLDVAKELEPVLRGKIVVDCTNPFSWDKGPVWNPPASGSITAELVKILPESKIVKAFNTFGTAHMVNPSKSGQPAQVFMAGNDVNAKRMVAQIAERAKFRSLDVGPLRNAGALENMAILWIHLANIGGKGQDFVFATLPE